MVMLQVVNALAALLAAVFWLRSARIKIPDLPQTKASGEGSITHIMQEQSRLSAIAAAFACGSALITALSALLH